MGASHYHGSTYHPSESVGFLVKRVTNAISRSVDARMAEHGLTDAQWGPLLMISKGWATTAADVACIAQTDNGAVTRMVDRLEAKGLVRRARSIEDRRMVHLELTAEGARIAENIPYVLSDVLNEMLDGFSTDEVSGLKRLLCRMLDNAGVGYDLDAIRPERRAASTPAP